MQQLPSPWPGLFFMFELNLSTPNVKQRFLKVRCIFDVLIIVLDWKLLLSMSHDFALYEKKTFPPTVWLRWIVWLCGGNSPQQIHIRRLKLWLNAYMTFRQYLVEISKPIIRFYSNVRFVCQLQCFFRVVASQVLVAQVTICRNVLKCKRGQMTHCKGIPPVVWANQTKHTFGLPGMLLNT